MHRFCALLLLAVARGQTPPEFTSTEAEIVMRDGLKLHTEIHTPKNAAGPLGMLMIRTPYNAASSSGRLLKGGGFSALTREGYIFVFQDIRGRYKSEGTFVMMRAPRDNRSDPRAFDEGTDSYDTIAWLVKNVPGNNARVGIFGISYPGWTTVMAMLEPHPALKAVSEQASPADMWLGDDFHHNGAFRLSYGFEYASSMETGKSGYSFSFDKFDLFEWYRALLPLASANDRYFHGKLPTWNAYVEHPDYDDYWKKIAVTPYLNRVTVPNLNVSGWWDQEDFYGPQAIYRKLEKSDTAHWNYFVCGPWNHGGWDRGDGRTLGVIDFGADTAKYYRENIEAPWFAYWLKDRGDGKFAEARTFQTGANRWQTHDKWPPVDGIQERQLYFRENGRLDFEAPRAAGFDQYISDPANPVPYRQRPVSPTYGARPGWSTWLVQDQRLAHRRPDVLTLETAPLAADLAVTGDVVAHLYASSSGTDSDWIVKLIDVYPENDATLGGFQLMVSNEVFRARYRKSFERPEPLRPNAVEHYAIDLHGTNHVYRQGHKIMVQVQSTWFPVIDRNPQRFVPNIYKASAADYRPATQRIFRARDRASHIRLPVAAARP
jgi:putative CocE/NonD family hydrolase